MHLFNLWFDIGVLFYDQHFSCTPAVYMYLLFLPVVTCMYLQQLVLVDGSSAVHKWFGRFLCKAFQGIFMVCALTCQQTCSSSNLLAVRLLLQFSLVGHTVLSTFLCALCFLPLIFIPCQTLISCHIWFSCFYFSFKLVDSCYRHLCIL
jgi:hypothetical protein